MLDLFHQSKSRAPQEEVGYLHNQQSIIGYLPSIDLDRQHQHRCTCTVTTVGVARIRLYLTNTTRQEAARRGVAEKYSGFDTAYG